MVPRLRVAIRVVSEDEYLTHLAKGPPGPAQYGGEKKFPVVIPNPQQWQIGHLAAEIKRHYRKLYGRDVGTIKYLSHGFDDCELHKDLSVYDHLYDEGKARTDPGDQYVVVKAVFSQGRPLREGSIMPDFDDPRYERRPVPPVPVPSWPVAPSKPSKRPFEEGDERYFGTNEYPDPKRQRLSDPEDAGSEDDIAQSVERDELMQGGETFLPTSQTVIHDSQSSPQGELFQPSRQQSLSRNGTASFQPSPTSSSGQIFSSSRRLKFDHISDSSADLPIPKHLRFDPNHGQTHALLTPPSDASKRNSNGETIQFPADSPKSKSPPAQATPSGLRRPGVFKTKDVYDMDESDDIECSAMSPKSKQATAKKLSRSGSGPKSASKASRNRKESETPDRFNGSVPNSEVIKLMEDVNHIPPASLRRPKPDEESGLVDDEARAALRHPQVSKGKIEPLSLREKLVTANRVAATSPEDKNKRKREWRSQHENQMATNSLHVNTTHVQPDTKQSTPVDSPGEQLLEMQASSQKSQPDPRRRRRTKKKSQIEPEREETVASPPKALTVDRPAKEAQLQKPNLMSKVQAVEDSPTLDSKAAEERAEPNSASTSPYARPSPPKGSMGLGFTNSPRRSSIMSASGSSMSPRRLFQTESAPAPRIKAAAIAHDRSDSDSSDESSVVAVATPSKEAPKERSLSPYLRGTEEPKPVDEPQGSVAISRTKSESVFDSDSPAIIPQGMTMEQYNSIRYKRKDVSLPVVALPKGMTMEQYESIKNRNNDAPSKERRQPSAKERKVLQAQAERAIKARESSIRSTSSIAASEEPEARKKNPPQRKSTVKAVAVVIENTRPKQPERRLEAPTQKKATRPGTKASSTPSTTASDSSKASQSALLKATRTTKPTSTTSSSTKTSQAQPAGKKATPAATPTASFLEAKTPLPTGPQPGSLLKSLKRRVAGQSARSSPAAPNFALAPKPVARGFGALAEDSDDEDDESESEDDEAQEKVVRGMRSDQRVRSVAVQEEDDDDDDESEEGDED